MQTTFQTARPSLGAFKASSLPAARRSTMVVRAQSNVDFIKEIGKSAAVLAAGLALTMVSEEDRRLIYFHPQCRITLLYERCTIFARFGHHHMPYINFDGRIVPKYSLGI